MAKTIRLIGTIPGLIFSIGNREITVSETMPLEDAERIATQYPGQYLEIVEEPTSSPTPIEPAPEGKPGKPGK